MDRDRRIEARAYEIWEREGRPEGRHEDHWAEAAREIEAEAAGRGDGAAEGPTMEAPGPDAGKPGRRRAAAAIAAEDAEGAPKTGRGRGAKVEAG